MRKVLLIGALVLLALVLGAGGVGYWIVYSPNTPDYEGERSVYLPRGTSYPAAVDSLAASGVLDARRTFNWMARLTGWGSQIKAGHYRIASGASNYNLLGTLRRGEQTPVRLTIPPGTRPEVAAAVAGRDMAFTKEAFLSALKDTALASELGTDTTHLFAYMRPETYSFYWLTDAQDAVRSIKEQFDDFYRTARAQADSLPGALTKEEVLTLASIVEWETGLRSERPRVAGVYLNRMERGMALQADPTIQYALLQTEGQKRRLLYEDYEIQHPYNTYNYRGLPPGPLTNPSASSIRAVLNPEKHDYFYFVANPDGAGHTFSRNLREHNRAARKYRQTMRQRRQQQRQDSLATAADSTR